MTKNVQLKTNLHFKINMYKNCRADNMYFSNEETASLPIVDVKGRIPTLNKTGHMCTKLDEISLSFIRASKNAKAPVLEIGAAYGAASQKALANNATVFANDIDLNHLYLLKQQVNPQYWNRLYLDNRRLPDETNFPENMFSNVLMCRVAHFLSGKEIESAIDKIYKWLIPGGRLFFLVLSPFHRRLKAFLPVYEKKWAEGILWPGEIHDGQTIWPEFSEYIPKSLHVMDSRPIKSIVEKTGFYMQRNELFGYPPSTEANNTGEYFGFIAIKKTC